jgi:hypothetical protein
MARNRRNKNRSYQKQSRAYRRNTKPRLRSAPKYTDPNPNFVRSRRLNTTNYQTKTQANNHNNTTTHTTTTIIPAKQNVREAYAKQTLSISSLPTKVQICIKRKQRKEIIHALNKSGKSGQRKQKRNQHSNTHC